MSQRADLIRPPTSAPAASPSRPMVRRACACGRHNVAHAGNGGECAECRQKRLGLQRRAVGRGPDVAPPIVHEVLRSPGRPLARQSHGESRFSHDFSQVRAQTVAAQRGVLQRQPAAGGSGNQPGVFAQNKVTTTSPVKSSTAGLIQSALTASQLLRPHLTRLGTGKDQVQITDKFIIHADLNLFAGAWATFTGRPTMHISDELRNEAAGIGGFYDRANRTIHLNPKATLGDALHEAMHKVSTRAVGGMFGPFLDEGVTQYFTDQVMREQQLPIATNHRYGPNLTCANALIGIAGEPEVAAMQFAGRQIPQVRQAVMNRLRITEAELIQLGQKDQLCARMTAAVAPPRRPAQQPAQNQPAAGARLMVGPGERRLTTAAAPTLQRAFRPWPFNGRVINRSHAPVTVWSDGDGLYTIAPDESSDRFSEDVDHVRDSRGQWYKVGVNTTMVYDSEVMNYACAVHNYGDACP